MTTLPRLAPLLALALLLTACFDTGDEGGEPLPSVSDTGQTADADATPADAAQSCEVDADCTDAVCDPKANVCVECLETSHCQGRRTCQMKECVGGELVVEPADTLVFRDLAIGQSKTKSVRLQNVGDGPLPITGLTLEENEEDSQRELRAGMKWTTGAEIAPGETLEIEVTYQPLNRTADSGQLIIDHDGAVDEDGLTTLAIEAPE
jgi:hypothetical protein